MSTPANTRPRKLLAELSGTFFVVFVVIGAAAIGAGPLAISLAYGAAYAAAIAALGPVSGGHFNPAVTIAHWVTHRFGTFDALVYFAAQLAGAIAAAYALRFALIATINAAAAVLLRPPTLAAGVTRLPALLAEAAGTAALVAALWATIVARQRPHWWFGGLVAGTATTVGSFFAAPYTGGVLNPARALGPAVAAGQWAYQGVYWVGPLAGGVAAAALCDLLFRRGASPVDAALKGSATQRRDSSLRSE